MTQVAAYTPEWLARPSPGFDFFTSFSADRTDGPSSTSRCLTQRATELFVASGTEIHWADLHLSENASDIPASKGWRSLKTPVVLPIQQLSVSPDGNLLTIVTQHTCHVSILPTSAHLRSGDDGPLRLRTFQVGPTAHVLEQAAISSCLWHPLSISGLQSLVTVTTDACVRLWELDINNRSSFDQPSTAVDLKKLANATSTASDISTSKFGANRGFSPDEVEMEVASACFGGQGLEDEHGWASMTLWFAMSEGDVYALCPFLPSRFRLPNSTLPTLSTGVIAEAQMIAADQTASDVERLRSQTQSAWLADLDDQEPVMLPGQHEFDLVESYSRPGNTGSIAKLQGPFHFTSSLSSEITDIYVVAPTIDDAILYSGEEDQDMQRYGLSMSIVALSTASGQVHVCLNMDDVEAQWLPEKPTRAYSFDDEAEASDLLVLETVILSSDGAYATFTASPVDRYQLLVTTTQGVYSLDFNPWAHSLEDELAGDGTAGVDFRLKVLLESTGTSISRLITASDTGYMTAIALIDSHLGYMVLTSTVSGPHSVTISLPSMAAVPYEPDSLILPTPELRETYQPAGVFHASSELDKFLARQHNNPITKAELAQPIRSRTETLALLTEAHRTLSQETYQLGLAAADLFRRCERMCAELSEQVRTVDDISQKVTAVTDTGAEDENEDSTVDAHIDQRIMQIQSNADNMNERFEHLRRKMLRLGGNELSNKEHAFTQEVQQIQHMTGGEGPNASMDSIEVLNGSEAELRGVLSSRLQSASDLRDTLVQQTEDYGNKQHDEGQETKKTASSAAANEYKKQKLGRVMQLLERESAMMEAVTERLGRLGGLS